MPVRQTEAFLADVIYLQAPFVFHDFMQALI